MSFGEYRKRLTRDDEPEVCVRAALRRSRARARARESALPRQLPPPLSQTFEFDDVATMTAVTPLLGARTKCARHSARACAYIQL